MAARNGGRSTLGVTALSSISSPISTTMISAAPKSAGVGDGNEIAGTPHRLGGSNEGGIGRWERKRASVEGCSALAAALGRQIDADDGVQRIACTIARRSDCDGVGGTDKAEALHADDLAAALVAQEIA